MTAARLDCLPTVIALGQTGLVTWETRPQVVAATDSTRLDIAAPSPRKVLTLWVKRVMSKTCGSKHVFFVVFFYFHCFTHPPLQRPTKSLCLSYAVCSVFVLLSLMLTLSQRLMGIENSCSQLNFLPLSARVSVFLVHSEHL